MQQIKSENKITFLPVAFFSSLMQNNYNFTAIFGEWKPVKFRPCCVKHASYNYTDVHIQVQEKLE